MKPSTFLLISLLMLAAAFTLPTITGTSNASAQIIKTVTPTTAKDSVVNTDTIYIALNPPTNYVTGFHVSGTRSTGTVAGKIYWQGSINGVNYVTVDSTTLVNAAYVLASLATPNNLPFVRYRAMYTSSGTNKVTGIRGHMVTRQR